MRKKSKKPSFLTFQGRLTCREFRRYAEIRANKIIGRVRSFIFFSNTRNVAMQQLPHRDVNFIHVSCPYSSHKLRLAIIISYDWRRS